MPNGDFSQYVRSTVDGDIEVHRLSDDSIVAKLPNIHEHPNASFGPGSLLLVHGGDTHQFWLWDLTLQRTFRFYRGLHRGS